MPWALPRRPFRSLRGQYSCSHYARELLLGSFETIWCLKYVSHYVIISGLKMRAHVNCLSLIRWFQFYSKFILFFRTCEPTPITIFTYLLLFLNWKEQNWLQILNCFIKCFWWHLKCNVNSNGYAKNGSKTEQNFSRYIRSFLMTFLMNTKLSLHWSGLCGHFFIVIIL